MANRLQYETSPYLRQHAENPVDWYPWGEEALNDAREQDKPILLSIGYSACHWCHVMEHESFSSERIAGIMNRHFISVKVDREERPDLDAIYMTAVQMLTGQGGWPMTVFLTPEGRPFYGGTYFPPEDRGPMPGFPRVLQALAQTWNENRDKVEESSMTVKEHLDQHFSMELEPTSLTVHTLDEAARSITQYFDEQNGGFGGAPKFPSSMVVDFLLRTWQRTGAPRSLQMAEKTLQKMARGGIYDQVGGGFHRYTVDAIWLVPHFEKMLYDNALLARTYVDAWRVTGNELYQKIATGTLEYVQREMTSPDGGFYSTQDADSEGVEGKFYVWEPGEIDEICGDDAAVVKRYYAVTDTGNFEGKNILNVPEEPETVAGELGITTDELATTIERANAKLYSARSERVWPARDDKVLTAWNGLMMRAFVEGAVAFNRSDFLETALRNARFLRDTMLVDGRLRRTWMHGDARLNGYLEDYSYTIDALIALYQATFDEEWLVLANQLATTMLEEFRDETNGGFYDTGISHEELVTRPKDVVDNAVPSGNSVASDALLKLSLLAGDDLYRKVGSEILERYGAAAAQQPVAFGRLLCAVDFAVAETREVALVGHPDDSTIREMRNIVYRQFQPHLVQALRDPEGRKDITDVIPLLEGRELVDGKPAAYVCRNYVCQRPVTDVDALASELETQAGL